jgi:hypothetical protein
MTELRPAIAGAGLIGRAHWERIRAHAGCTLVGMADPPPTAAELAAEAQLPLYAQLEEMLAGQRPEGVILATPNALHVPGALACVAAGVPALVEKPVADSLAPRPPCQRGLLCRRRHARLARGADDASARLCRRGLVVGAAAARTSGAAGRRPAGPPARALSRVDPA